MRSPGVAGDWRKRSRRGTFSSTLPSEPLELDAPTPADERIAAELGERGWSVVADFLDAGEVQQLARDLRNASERGAFRPAGVGRGASFRIDPEIRSDRALWLDPESGTPAEHRYFARMERLRQALNQRLYLGLFGFEAQFALYPPGAFYKAHLDRFATAPHRAVTTTLYLNEDWGPADGGALRLHLEGSAHAAFEDVAPLGGTLAVFLSDRFLHEVLPARRDRLSLSGWFTRRP